MAKSKKKKYTRYTAAKLRLRNIRFWLCWVALVVLIVIGVRYVYRYFDDSLRAFEAAQPDDVIQQTASIFTERRFDELYNYEDSSVARIETREDYVDYLNRLTEKAEITYKEVASGDDSKRNFVVMADDKKFANFTIRKTGEAAEFELIPLIGYKLKADYYEFDSLSTSILQPATYQVTVRNTDTLFVNGEPLSNEYIIRSGETMFYEGHLPSDVPSPTLTTYRFTCALDRPVIQVKDALGEEYSLCASDEYTYAYEFQYCDEEMRDAYDDLVLACAQDICRYTTDNQTQERVLKHMVDKSVAEVYIKNIEALWRTKADKYSFDNIVIGNYAKFGDDVFCCDIHLDYNTTSKHVDNSYPVSYRFYFMRVKNEWQIYDFENL